MAEFLTHPFTGEQVAKRILFLAYQASRVVGMGVIHAKDDALEQEVWEQCVNNRWSGHRPGQISADYVFGRMMKLSVLWSESGVTIPHDEPRPDYQSWCTTYRTAADLIAAAILSLGNERSARTN